MKTQAIIPLAIFIILVLVLGVGLTLDPSKVESPLINKPLPTFSLPSLNDPDKTLASADLKGKVSLLNVWGSWCPSCRDEHQMLLYIARTGLPIYGFNYKDTREAAHHWLDNLGDPYIDNFFDSDGHIGIELGVYGAPETFVINTDGLIAYKHIGPITPAVWETKLLPLIQSLQKDQS